MPRTDVVFYREHPHDIPVLDWLKKLRRKDHKAYEKCVAAIEMLAACGHELRRPLADTLRDGIHELRIRKAESTTGFSTSFMGEPWRSWDMH